MDLNRVQKGKFGILARRNGLTLDYAREAAEEAGYLRPGSDINDLLDAIRETALGHPVFRPGDEGDWRAFQAAERHRQLEADADPWDPNTMFEDHADDPAHAVNDLASSARREPYPEAAQASAAADEATRNAKGSEFERLRQEVAELRALLPEREPEPEDLAVQAGLEMAESRARAAEQAAGCLMRSA